MDMNDAELRLYVPDVYQEDIYRIDYEKLREKGIELISFDIDDTISDSLVNKFLGNMPGLNVTMDDRPKELFKRLKNMGFTVTLLTNTSYRVAEDVFKELDADGYIAKAKKPDTWNFKEMAAKCGKDVSQMAHVGNEICEDVLGGNRAGVVTCLVRRAGFANKAKNKVLKVINPTESQLVKAELEKRDMWRKLGKYHPGDQYYQLGEQPRYRQEPGTAASDSREGKVTIVCDGKAPKIAADNLFTYICKKGFSAESVDCDKYIQNGVKVGNDKLIIVGHHDFTKENLECAEVEYDCCGMKFGYSENRCALLASRSALGKGKPGREQFEVFYNDRIQLHKELAEEYGVPMRFGERDKTRKSQYDLLWLEFVKYGLPDFLGISLDDDVSPDQTEVKKEAELS